MNERTRWIGLILFVLVCVGAGGLGAVATTPEIDGWYRTVVKPEWNPPNSVFGPVWTTHFVLMGISAWLVWRLAGFQEAATPLSLFAVQLILNVAGGVDEAVLLAELQ